MFFETTEVLFGVVGGSVLPHFPEDFQPALGEAAQGTSVAFAAGAKALVVGFGPSGLKATATGPEMESMAQESVALAANTNAVDLSTLEADGCRASQTLEGLRRGEALAVLTQFGEQARSERGAGAGQGAKEVMVGMASEEFLDTGAVRLQLVLELVKQRRQREGEATLGRHHGGRRFPLQNFGEGGQAMFGGLRTPQAVAMKELLPLAAPGLGEELRGWKGQEKIPRRWECPIVKGFERRRIVFLKCSDELVDQQGALLNEDHFIAAEQAQFQH